MHLCINQKQTDRTLHNSIGVGCSATSSIRHTCGSQILSANEPCPKLGTSVVELLCCKSQHTDGPKTFIICHAWNIIKPCEIPHHQKKKHRKTTSLNLQDSSILHIHHIINISPFHSCSYPFLHVCSWVSPFRSSIASRNSCSSSRTSLTSSRPCKYAEWRISMLNWKPVYKELRNEKQHNKNI